MATKKAAQKKAAPKKVQLKKAPPKKRALIKSKPGKTIQKEIILRGEIEETQPSGDCMCKQKRPNGNFFSFRLVQGRWVQSSSVPFPTQELCEEVNC